MIRVGVSGGAGRMGRLVAETVAAADDLTLHGLYDPAGAGAEVAGLAVADDPSALAGAEVVVEFTRPDVVIGNIERWRGLGAHAVVGTSGFDDASLARVRELWPTGPPNCLVVPNFSIGACVLLRVAELAAPHFEAAELIELHHDRKADAPSGTAYEIARRLSGTRRSGSLPKGTELAPGSRGADVGGVRVHSVRLPGLLAHHEVVLGNPGETLQIRHDSTDRSSFMPGVLLAVRSVGGLEEPVTVGIEGLLGL